MVYLFIGQDSPAKDIALKRIKDEFLPPRLEDFNLDVLYPEKLSLDSLQERLLGIPVKSPKRIILIRNAQKLQKGLSDFIVEWSARQNNNIILILDIEERAKSNTFVSSLNKCAKVINFKEEAPPNTFDLSRQIESRQVSLALNTLGRLIKEGERPERILGGLRYSLEGNIMNSIAFRRRLKLLLNCDIEIKTGRLKPVFALEKLVVNLCAFV